MPGQTAPVQFHHHLSPDEAASALLNTLIVSLWCIFMYAPHMLLIQCQGSGVTDCVNGRPRFRLRLVRVPLCRAGNLHVAAI